MKTETLHNILLSVHLLGVFLLLIGLAIEMVALVGMRKAQSLEDLRGALYAAPAVGKTPTS
jgi:hypothetical protein